MSNSLCFSLRALGLGLICCAGFEVRTARAAEPSDPAAAEALFAQGKALMQHGDYGQACPKLEESYRLDPATGALLALALCHEGQGKLATAWVEFMNVASLANAEHNSEREQSARRRADALGQRLPFLVLRVSSALEQVPGLVILHDGIALRPAAWGTPIPVDPGRHVLRASAPGRKEWKTVVVISEPGQRAVAEVPELLPLEAKVSESATKAPATKSSFWTMTPLRLTGVGLMSAGTTSLLFAAGASWRALAKDADATDHCTPKPCTPTGLQEAEAAREAANFATVGAIAGSALLGAGVALFVLGKPSEDRASLARWSLAVSPVGAELRRDF